MAEVLDFRKKAKIAIAALLVVDIAAVVLLFSPLVGSESSRREQLDQLWQELQRKDARGRTAQGCGQEDRGSQPADRRVLQDPAARAGFGDLRGTGQGSETEWRSRSDRFAPRPRTRTRWACARWRSRRIFPGDYLQLVRFINSLERDPLFFIIDSVDLGGEQSGVVKLQLKLETYQKASG